MQDNRSLLLSIVIPVFNAENMLNELCHQLTSVIKSLNIKFEIVLVEDFSIDNSWEVIKKLCQQHPYIKGIKLGRNFGQQIAVSAGIASVKGKYVILMDCDLQNPTDCIPSILKKLQSGYDLVYTVAKERNNFKDQLTSRAFWFLITKLLKVNIIKNQLMMRGMSERFVKYYDKYSEVNPTVAGISHDIGLKHTVIEVKNNLRYSGKSNYNYFKRFHTMMNIIMDLSTVPLTIIISISVIIFVLNFFAILFYLYNFLFNSVASGFTTIVILIIGFGSLIMLSLGIVGSYIANIYKEVKKRPLFTIDEKVNF